MRVIAARNQSVEMNVLQGSFRYTREVMKSALAGVGSPMNVSDCRSSTLNLASLKAEKTASRNAR